jgi:hypothetical protein
MLLGLQKSERRQLLEQINQVGPPQRWLSVELFITLILGVLGGQATRVADRDHSAAKSE